MIHFIKSLLISSAETMYSNRIIHAAVASRTVDSQGFTFWFCCPGPGSLQTDTIFRIMHKKKNSHSTAIKPTPAQIANAGKIEKGVFRQPFRTVNLLDTNLVSAAAGRGFRNFRLKEWVGFGITHEDMFGGILIQNAKYVGSGVVYLYDRKERQMHEWKIVVPASSVQIPEALWNGSTSCSFRSSRMQFEHKLESKYHHINAQFPATRKKPKLEIDITAHQNIEKDEPLVVSFPIARHHHTYTHKSPLSLEGSIKFGERTIRFDPKTHFGNLDEQKTFYPYRSSWKWGTFVYKTAENTILMLNFVNQMTPPGEQGEDALWVDGRLEMLEQPLIKQLDPDHWRVETADKSIALDFTRDGEKKEVLNLGLVMMNYAQMFGNYNGTVRDASGQTHTIVNAYGALEKMKARF